MNKTKSKPKKTKVVFIPLPSKQPINEELYERYGKKTSIIDLLKIIDK